MDAEAGAGADADAALGVPAAGEADDLADLAGAGADEEAAGAEEEAGAEAGAEAEAAVLAEAPEEAEAVAVGACTCPSLIWLTTLAEPAAAATGETVSVIAAAVVLALTVTTGGVVVNTFVTVLPPLVIVTVVSTGSPHAATVIGTMPGNSVPLIVPAVANLPKLTLASSRLTIRLEYAACASWSGMSAIQAGKVGAGGLLR